MGPQALPKEAEMEITMNFPGGKRVDALFDGFQVKTDQPKEEGGEGTAPLSPVAPVPSL